MTAWEVTTVRAMQRRGLQLAGLVAAVAAAGAAPADAQTGRTVEPDARILVAARQIARDLKEARKQLAANKRCENHLRAEQWDQAIAAAREGMAAYPQATLARLCLVSALRGKKASPDEVIAAGNEVLKIDPTSRIALGLVYEAQRAKGNNEAAIATLMLMQKADPTNPQLGPQIAAELARLD